ncbi:hypothetical protein JHFBIEKO_2257 [Methylobacterium mesophilicum]|uniref:IS66 family transposase n=1 Tax=Methylobacterium mesophilicum TaxID=39956 RepID=UPI001EE2AE6A|nr:IS66 family transposase [Methylobacterium mesophilicum]GJE21809.1 hypothetical protein JHFBIEKO_2257 [Methylobacterium mesophilicum]
MDSGSLTRSCPVACPAIARERAGPRLLSPIAVAKFDVHDDHLPLSRQAAIYAHNGVPSPPSTPRGWPGASAATVMPLVDLLRHEVIAGSDALNSDDTPAPLLAADAGKAKIGRLWICVRNECPIETPGRRWRCYSPHSIAGASKRLADVLP